MSARARAIAARVLAFNLDGEDGQPDVTTMGVAVGFSGVGWDAPFTWLEIRTLAAAQLAAPRRGGPCPECGSRWGKGHKATCSRAPR